ncbi:MAG: IclR family transcriptional regulator [Mycobacteriaceae bacterium]
MADGGRRSGGAAPGGASFVRGLNVLIAVAELGEARADEIAVDVDVPLSTVYRYLRTLCELQLVEERDGSYVQGWRWIELSGREVAHTRLVELGHSFLREIAECTGETAVLAVRAGNHAVCLRQVESHHPMRMAFKIGQLLPLDAGAGQRMLLAHAPAAVVEHVLAEPVPHATGRPRSRSTIARELEQVRRQRFLVSHGELSDGAVAVSVPVFADGEIACSLTAAGPENRCDAAWQATARSVLVELGGRLSNALGERGAHTPRETASTP